MHLLFDFCRRRMVVCSAFRSCPLSLDSLADLQVLFSTESPAISEAVLCPISYRCGKPVLGYKWLDGDHVLSVSSSKAVPLLMIQIGL